MNVNTESHRDGVFPDTVWTRVITLQEGCEEALESLCRTYWYPLYAFVRRYGKSVADAEDITQGFITKVLEREWLQDASRERCKFRTFLLTRLKRYMIDEWRKLPPVGDPRVFVSIDGEEAESLYTHEPKDNETPEVLFQQAWVATLLRQVHEQLGREFSTKNEEGLFEKLQPCLARMAHDKPYAELAEELGKTEGWVKTVVRRMRQRFRELLVAEIERTVTDGREVDEEINALFAAFEV